MLSKRLILGFFLAITLVFSTVPATAQKNEDGKITLDFEDVELRNLIRFIAEATGKNFIVDSRVNGKATMVSPRPVDAKEALSIFESLLSGSGYAIVPAGKVSRIIPINEASQAPVDLLGMKNTEKRRADEVVTKLLRLEKVSVNSVMPVIKPLLSKKATISAYPPKNTLVITESYGNLVRIDALVKNLDRADENTSSNLDVIYLKNANAVEVADVVKGMIEGSDEKSDESKGLRELAAFRGKVSVVADKTTNAIVVSAEPNDMALVKTLVQRLDIQRMQVYVEALVMEVSSEVSDQFGVEWRSASDLTSDGIAPFGGTSFGSTISGLAANPLNMPSGFSFGVSGGTIDFNGTEYANIGLLVNALKSNTSVNILSTPQLLTLDNQEAEIMVGDTVPFITGTYNPGGTDDNPFQTIERKDIGLTLRLTPQISENGFIRMNIFQEISSINETATASDLVTRKRSIRTSVVVADGSMVVLGGLIRDDVNEVDQQVPCLANIFGVGEMFKNNSSTNTKTNLMVFIKPKILNTYGKMDQVTTEKYKHMRTLQMERKMPSSAFVPQRHQEEATIVPDHMRYTTEDYVEDYGHEPGVEPEEQEDEAQTPKVEEVEAQVDQPLLMDSYSMFSTRSMSRTPAHNPTPSSYQWRPQQ